MALNKKDMNHSHFAWKYNKIHFSKNIFYLPVMTYLSNVKWKFL